MATVTLSRAGTNLPTSVVYVPVSYSRPVGVHQGRYLQGVGSMRRSMLGAANMFPSVFRYNATIVFKPQ